MKSLLVIAVLAVIIKNGSAQNGSAQNGSVQIGSSQNGSAQNESADNFLLDICMKNFDYHAHPTECNKFIQCRYTNGNILIGEIQPCPFPSYWNQSLLTCIKPSEMECKTDMCQNEVDDMKFPGEKNCRGYWECKNGKSVPMCCQAGKKYVNSTIGCIDNEIKHECNDTCMDDEYMFEMFDNETAVFENETTTANETMVEKDTIVKLCEKEVVPGQPTMYQIRLTGFPFPVPMMCAPGTVFNKNTCNCVVPGVQPVMQSMKRECKPEVFLTFDNASSIMSGITKHIDINHVVIEDGKALFNGIDDKMIIPRFANVAHLDTVVIKVNYTSEHTKPGIARAIVSNSGENCDVPSILLSEDSSNIYFGAGTTGRSRMGSFAYTYLEHEATPVTAQMTRKSVTYKLKNEVLSGQFGNNMTEVSAPGNLLNVHCPIHVGYAKQLARFEGELESLEIYLCDPDEM